MLSRNCGCPEPEAEGDIEWLLKGMLMIILFACIWSIFKLHALLLLQFGLSKSTLSIYGLG
jgi:hypothetical protein